MVFVITGNNSERLRTWSEFVCKAYPGCVIYEYIDPMLSAKYIINNHVDVVLAEEKMRPVNGVVLRRVLNMHKPDLPVIILPERMDEAVSGCFQGKENFYI